MRRNKGTREEGKRAHKAKKMIEVLTSDDFDKEN